ncbi:MAG: sulfatase [Candidatus Aminicenantes bacterium]|nr:MAG: sulfatase [Candidatus Aminicenantes bacterium]
MKNPERQKKIGIILIVFLILAVIVLIWRYGFVSSGSHSAMIQPKSRPNIVLVIVDTLRADKLGCYGFPGGISPGIDAMAEKGVLFENVISQCSWTRPSIGSMITAFYPRSIGIFKEKFDILDDKYLTLAEVLQDNGYYTFGITANPNINKIFNFHQGFDDYEDSAVIWGWMKPEAGQKIFSDDSHLPRSRDIFNRVLKKAESMGPEPVYIQINIMEVHSPYLIREEFKDSFKNYPVRKVNFKYSAEKLTRLVRGTLAAVKQVSHDIDEFVKKLRVIPGWENTLFVITSDHGQGLDDHPDVYRSHTHGNYLYESQLMVPLIFYHIGSPQKIYKPHQVKEKVRLLDLMPTILDYVGISPPEGIHGVSLINFIKDKGEKPQLPRYFIAETNWRKIDKIAVYTDQWKYFENKDDWGDINKRELQPSNITENGKLTDKIHEYREIGKEMKRILYQWEKQYKRAKRTFPQGTLSKEEVEQLKSLGYLN